MLLSRRVGAVVLGLIGAGGLSWSAPAGAVQQISADTFTYAHAEVFYDGLSGSYPAPASTTSEGSILSVSAEQAGWAPGQYAQARASLGSNGFAAGSGSTGTSIWSDGFNITGGVGSGQIDVSVAVHGTVVGNEADMMYTLFVSDHPFTAAGIVDAMNANDQRPVVAGATELLHTEVFNGVWQNSVLTSKLSFTYGQTFYVASVLTGDVAAACVAGPFNCGSEDFYHSATFGVTAPGGAVIEAVSGATYMPAVPEPGSMALLGAGALAMASAVRRRSRSARAA